MVFEIMSSSLHLSLMTLLFIKVSFLLKSPFYGTERSWTQGFLIVLCDIIVCFDNSNQTSCKHYNLLALLILTTIFSLFCSFHFYSWILISFGEQTFILGHIRACARWTYAWDFGLNVFCLAKNAWSHWSSFIYRYIFLFTDPCNHMTSFWRCNNVF